MKPQKSKLSAKPGVSGSGVASSVASPGGSGIDIPASPGDIPASYQLVAFTHLLTTMGKPGRHGNYAAVGNVRWECYAYVAQGQPQSRNTVWLVGTFPGGAPVGQDIDLHDIGAQHRSLQIWLRASSTSPLPTIEVYQVERQGGKVRELLQPEDGSTAPDRKGFYAINRSGGYGNNTYENRYVIVTKARHLLLEVFFDEHPPGVGAQPEDGGPPPLPPVNQAH